MRRLSLPLLLALALLLVAPAVAGAGGFATAGLSSTPDGTAPGEPWKVDITLLQHGVEPLVGMEPRIQITNGKVTRDFAAKELAEDGVYRAEVVFPSAGRWDYVVFDGFNNDMPHTFPAVRIGDGAASPEAPSPAKAAAPAPSGPDDGGVAAGWLWGAGLVLLLALALLLADRERRTPRAPHGAEVA